MKDTEGERERVSEWTWRTGDGGSVGVDREDR